MGSRSIGVLHNTFLSLTPDVLIEVVDLGLASGLVEWLGGLRVASLDPDLAVVGPFIGFLSSFLLGFHFVLLDQRL